MSIDTSAVARTLGIQTNFTNFRAGSVVNLPQRIAVIAEGRFFPSYSLERFTTSSPAKVAARFGQGTPLALIARSLFPAIAAEGVGSIPVDFYPLPSQTEGHLRAFYRVLVTGFHQKAGTYRFKCNGVLSAPFVLPASTVSGIPIPVISNIQEAVNSDPDMPILITEDFTFVRGSGGGGAFWVELDMLIAALWEGENSNQVTVEVVGPNQGLTFAVSEFQEGVGFPDLSDALARIGDTEWTTLVISTADFDNEAALSKFQEFGEARWGQLTRKPLVVFTGNTEADPAAATTACVERRDDRINAYAVAPGSEALSFLVAAKQVAKIASVANNNPPQDYGAQSVPSLVPGEDSEQWDYVQRDGAIKRGCSTVEIRDGVLRIGDIVTFYRPSGEEPPGFRHVVDIIKLQNVIYNLSLEFEQPKWSGAPLIADNQASSNPTAKRPKDVKAAIASILDSLALSAIITDVETAKKNTVCQLNAQNPKRVDVVIPIALSGNTNILSIDLNFGFAFGG